MESLEQVLSECREYADDGLNMAQESLEKMKESLRKEKEELRSIEQKQDQIKRIENDPQVREQLREIEAFERKTIKNVERNLAKLKKGMGDFTIVLYGRTMAGKSTLMEILTHGNGESIGKGAQRTTLDVRGYTWNGLKIFDVPGTCSFGGKGDDLTAFEAAKSADMALFLLTDDAPQPEEADRLAELRKLGKPVLGIVNVKSNLNPDSVGAKRKIELKAIEKKIKDTERLEEIVHQFQGFAQNHGYDFSDIYFVSSHLKSAYLSQPEREDDDSLYELSNFSEVEKFIIDKVLQDGKFIRIKTFADSVALSMQNAIATMYGHSGQTVNTFWSFDEKITELRKWHSKFLEDTQSRYNTFIEGLESQLDQGVEYIVSEYYESSKAGEHWKNYIDRLGIQRQCQDFISKIGNKATKKMRALSDELTQDLRYAGASVEIPSISMDEITDTQSAMMLAAPLLALTPVGWAGAVALGLFSLVFGDSKSEKIRKAKNELRDKLNESKRELLSNIDDNVLKILNVQILHKQVDGFENALFGMRDMRERLAYVQKKMADTVNDLYRDLNYRLLWEAMEYTGGNPRDLKEVFTARIVGDQFLVFSVDDMPVEIQKALAKLFQEKFYASRCDNDNYWNDVGRALESSILHQSFGMNTFIDEDWGRMSTIALEDKDCLSTEQKQLMEQIWDSPIR